MKLPEAKRMGVQSMGRRSVGNTGFEGGTRAVQLGKDAYGGLGDALSRVAGSLGVIAQQAKDKRDKRHIDQSNLNLANMETYFQKKFGGKEHFKADELPQEMRTEGRIARGSIPAYEVMPELYSRFMGEGVEKSSMLIEDEDIRGNWMTSTQTKLANKNTMVALDSAKKQDKQIQIDTLADYSNELDNGNFDNAQTLLGGINFLSDSEKKGENRKINVGRERNRIGDAGRSGDLGAIMREYNRVVGDNYDGPYNESQRRTAERYLDGEARAIKATAKGASDAAHDKFYNEMSVSISDGQTNRLQVNEAYELWHSEPNNPNALNPKEWRALTREYKVYENRVKKGVTDTSRVQSVLDGRTTANPTDSDWKKAVNQDVINRGLIDANGVILNEDGLMLHMSKTSTIPEALLVSMAGAPFQGNPEQVEQTVNIVGRMQRSSNSPTLMAQLRNENSQAYDMINEIAELRRSQVPIESAIETAQVNAAITPEQKEQRKRAYNTAISASGGTTNNEALQDLMHDSDKFDTGYVTSNSPPPSANMQASFDTLVHQYFVQTQNIDRARVMAFNKVSINFDRTEVGNHWKSDEVSTDTRSMELPPEMVLNAPASDVNVYLEEFAATHEIDPTKIILSTDNITRSGDPSWAVSIAGESGDDVPLDEDGQPIRFNGRQWMDAHNRTKQIEAERVQRQKDEVLLETYYRGTKSGRGGNRAKSKSESGLPWFLPRPRAFGSTSDDTKHRDQEKVKTSRAPRMGEGRDGSGAPIDATKVFPDAKAAMTEYLDKYSKINKNRSEERAKEYPHAVVREVDAYIGWAKEAYQELQGVTMTETALAQELKRWTQDLPAEAQSSAIESLKEFKDVELNLTRYFDNVVQRNDLRPQEREAYSIQSQKTIEDVKNWFVKVERNTHGLQLELQDAMQDMKDAFFTLVHESDFDDQTKMAHMDNFTKQSYRGEKIFRNWLLDVLGLEEPDQDMMGGLAD